MATSGELPVFVGVRGPRGTVVFPTRSYQAEAYRMFMNRDPGVEKIHYNKNGYVFDVVPFNTAGYSGSYPRFAVLINDKNEHHILSDDEDKLRGFVGWGNRVFSNVYGGKRKNKTYKRRKQIKRTKHSRRQKQRNY